uniref:F-box domain-containing protein n=1 Tax=Setaria digitata TaxID=48799 RepID=A0A915PXP1_9BILA
MVISYSQFKLRYLICRTGNIWLDLVLVCVFDVMDMIDDVALRNQPGSMCSSPLSTSDNLPKEDNDDLTDKNFCTQIKWDSLHLDEMPYVGYNERNNTDEVTLGTMPDLVMQCIFESFNLRDRCIASQVCKRWYYLLTCRFPMEDVTVLNIFQNQIYKDKISNNKNIGLKCYHIDKDSCLLVALRHCRIISSVKIWFADAAFAGKVLKKLKQAKIRMRCLDLYPYNTEKALEQAFISFPDLTGMTMRPHGQEFFWSGLDMYSFPKFTKMDTLMLDGFNIKPEVFLPESLTTLEWLNRSGKFLRIMPKLRYLVNLEYLMLGHAEFLDTAEFDSFLQVISSDNLPKLQYLIFRYCKIDSHRQSVVISSPDDDDDDDAGYERELRRNAAEHISEPDIKLNSLQMIKLDLCYTDLSFVIRRVISFTSSAMRVVSLNVISEETNYERIYDLSSLIAGRKLTLHFGILQKDTRAERREEVLNALKLPPASFGTVLGRFEASFLTDEALLRNLLLTHPLPRLTDIKFIQVSAVTPPILLHLSLMAPRLRKLSLINCEEDELDTGILNFISSFPSRISKSLQIIWKRKCSRPLSFYNILINDQWDLIKDFEIRVIPKKFAANKVGEKIVIWEVETKKTLYIQDFDVNDQGRILGIVMPPDRDISLYNSDFLENNESTSSLHL